MRVVVPYAVREPKTRLSSVLSADERQQFSRTMLHDVLSAVKHAGGSPIVLATESIDLTVPVTVDNRPLTAAVNNAIDKYDHPLGIIMADLALATPPSITDLFETPGDIVIAPGRAGGTNALVIRTSGYAVDYHGASHLDHLRAARAMSASVNEVDSYRLSTDIDEPDDLVEVYLRGEGTAADWLRTAGFRLSTASSRVTLTR